MSPRLCPGLAVSLRPWGHRQSLDRAVTPRPEDDAKRAAG